MNQKADWGTYVQSTHREHAEHYAGYAEQNANDYPALEVELANMMSAAEWSRRSGENSTVLQLVQWLYTGGVQFLDLRGCTREAIALLTWAVEASRRIGDRRSEGNQLGNLGIVYRELGLVEQAIEHYQQAMTISRETGDRRSEAMDLGNLGLAYDALGQVERAVGYYRQALAIAREIGDCGGTGSLMGGLGNAYNDLGQPEQAIKHAEAALDVFEQIESPRAAMARKRLAEWRSPVLDLA